MPGPKTYQEIAVDRLYGAVDQLVNMFKTNVGNDQNHHFIRDSAPDYIKGISEGLGRFKSGPLAPEFRIPSGTFAAFTGLWNRKASMTACFETLQEFNTQMQGCKERVYEIMHENREGGGGGTTPDTGKPSKTDIELMAFLMEKSTALLEDYESCVKHGDQSKQQAIGELVRSINERLGQRTAKVTSDLMIRCKELWHDFMMVHQKGIGQLSLKYLMNFNAELRSADEKVMKAAA